MSETPHPADPLPAEEWKYRNGLAGLRGRGIAPPYASRQLRKGIQLSIDLRFGISIRFKEIGISCDDKTALAQFDILVKRQYALQCRARRVGFCSFPPQERILVEAPTYLKGQEKKDQQNAGARQSKDSVDETDAEPCQ